MREGMGDRAAICETYLLDPVQNEEHDGEDDEQRVVNDGGGRASLVSSSEMLDPRPLLHRHLPSGSPVRSNLGQTRALHSMGYATTKTSLQLNEDNK